MPAILSEAAEILAAHGQSHVLRYAAQLTPESLASLEAQVLALEWAALPGLIEQHLHGKHAAADFSACTPASAETLSEDAGEHGEALLRAGKVGVVTVAGGQGTRLGHDGPKGSFPLSPIRGASLFQLFAESLLRHGQLRSSQAHWYIMTSPLNDAATREYLEQAEYFGLDPDFVHIFTQGMMPCIGLDGKLLLAAPDHLAMSPDGHGGTLKALKRSGCLAQMAAAGIEHLSYFHIDNPLVPVLDPAFIGAHALAGAEISCRCLRKRQPADRLSNYVWQNGRLHAIEYSDMPPELAASRRPDGGLRYELGGPSIYLFRRDFIERSQALNLPYHRALKAVPHVDDPTPEAPNAVKLESFIFDALPLAEKPLLVEADWERCFAPVKNALGDESPATCRAALQAEHRRWLRGKGIALDPEVVVEIAPRAFVDAADFLAHGPSEVSPNACGELLIA
jgi:UDP-N-acetylglucosamine/UDP-N-acetylgalactosamine diphosphorylase